MKIQDRPVARIYEPIANNAVLVTISSAGRADFQTTIPGTTTNKQVKILALAYFGIELASVDKYCLRYRGGDQSERQRIGRLGQSHLHLTLVRKEASGRFGDALFLRRAS
jgi:hypothetical protein